MIVVEFEPSNAAAARAMVRTGLSRPTLGSALQRTLPEDFQGDLAGRRAPAPELLRALEAVTGPLPHTTRLCLQAPPRLGLYAKNGRVRVYLGGADDVALGGRVHDALLPVLHAASLAQGQWTSDVQALDTACDIAPSESAYRIPRLVLPLPAETGDDTLHCVEDALGDALYAAIIQQALWGAEPLRAIGLLPRRRQLAVAACNSVRRERYALDHSADVVIYTGVQIETNLRIRGPIFVGMDTHDGNGLLFPEPGC